MTANWLVLVCQIVTKFQIYPETAWVSTFMGPSQEIHGNPEIDFFIFSNASQNFTCKDKRDHFKELTKSKKDISF